MKAISINSKSIHLVFFALIGMVSCTYDKSELVYPPDTTVCDTLAISYINNIVPILSANCYTCHSTSSAVDGAGLKLDTYSAVSNQAKFGPLLQVIEHVPGFSFMPKNANKLSPCNIAYIRTWIRNGSPNN
ncbi:MAG: hypothetical protein V4717_22615 [Bacteroidota bacterium]